ncbi:MAG: cation transporter [Chlamydiae bacterium]|nr:cation transporter [Chlamydiota bacterium]
MIGLLMLIIKPYAYYITGSAAILSDAAESAVHVFAVGFAAYSMRLSLKPPDENHLYGHDKVSFFSAGFEGAMIIFAALFIIYKSIHKILFGNELENVDKGIFFIIFATLINLVLGFYLSRKGKKYNSIILEANGKHVLADCWTSFAAISALFLVKLTGIALFDPIVGILAGTNILWTGIKLIRRSVSGLMDQTDLTLHKQIIEFLSKETQQKNLEFHHLRHRLSGDKILVEFHLLFPNDLKLGKAHEIASEIEHHLKTNLDVESEIFTHLELKNQHDDIHKKYELPI